MSLKIPERFKIVDSKKLIVIIREDYEKNVDFFSNISVFEDDDKQNHNVFGRSKHRIISLTKSSFEKFVMRKAKRGGVIRFFLSDVFFGYCRPIYELQISEHALKNHIPTPEIVAITIFKLPFFNLYKFVIFTKFIPDCIQLRDYIINLHNAKKNFLTRKRNLIKKLSQEIKNMHNEGISHGDLHIRNIIIKQDETEDLFFVDLDKSVLKKKLQDVERFENIARLYRSILKDNNIQNTITRQDKLFFLKEYLSPEFTKEKAQKVIKYIGKRVRIHKFLWKIAGKR